MLAQQTRIADQFIPEDEQYIIKIWEQGNGANTSGTAISYYLLRKLFPNGEQNEEVLSVAKQIRANEERMSAQIAQVKIQHFNGQMESAKEDGAKLPIGFKPGEKTPAELWEIAAQVDELDSDQIYADLRNLVQKFPFNIVTNTDETNEAAIKRVHKEMLGYFAKIYFTTRSLRLKAALDRLINELASNESLIES